MAKCSTVQTSSKYAMTVGEFWRQSSNWPSGLVDYLANGEVCCRIHTGVCVDVAFKTGCVSWDPGTHRSVIAANEAQTSGLHCYADKGQLILDRRVAFEALHVKRDCFRALGRGSCFTAKYRKGFPVGLSVYGAGYCYLACFSPECRSRVARILGPLPLVVDVLRVARVMGDSFVRARWDIVADGIFHVVQDETVVSREGGFFMQGFHLVQQFGSQSRVGVGWNDCGMSGFVAGSLSTIGRTLGCCFPIVGDSEDRDEIANADRCQVTETTSLLGQGMIPGEVIRVSEPLGVAVVRPKDQPIDPIFEAQFVAALREAASVDTVVKKGKIFCNSCRYWVNPNGHADRCHANHSNSVVDHESFYRSWFGDSIHRLDVRIYLSMLSIPKVCKGPMEGKMTSAVEQAKFYVAYTGVKKPARGTSEHSLSTAFEESYVGDFRKEYITKVLEGVRYVDLPDRWKQYIDY